MSLMYILRVMCTLKKTIIFDFFKKDCIRMYICTQPLYNEQSILVLYFFHTLYHKRYLLNGVCTSVGRSLCVCVCVCECMYVCVCVCI